MAGRGALTNSCATNLSMHMCLLAPTASRLKAGWERQHAKGINRPKRYAAFPLAAAAGGPSPIRPYRFIHHEMRNESQMIWERWEKTALMAASPTDSPSTAES